MVAGKALGNKRTFILDTGSGYSLVDPFYFSRTLKNRVEKKSDLPSLYTVNGQNLEVLGYVRIKIELIPGQAKYTDMIAVRGIGAEIILGTQWMDEEKVILDFEKEEVQWPDGRKLTMTIKKKRTESPNRVTVIRNELIPPQTSTWIQVRLENKMQGIGIVTTPSRIMLEKGIFIEPGLIETTKITQQIRIVNTSMQPTRLFSKMEVGEVEPIERVCQISDESKEEDVSNEMENQKLREDVENIKLEEDNDLTEEEKIKIRELILKNLDVFASNPKKPGLNLITKHRIQVEESLPIKQRPYRTSQKEQAIIEKEVKEMLENGIVRPSRSPWSSPVVLVAKKDGTTRFCVDYRKLNKVTKKDSYPLPRIDDTLDKMKGKRYYTTLDLASGYWQVEIEESDKEKTAFVCHLGLFEFIVMPFGLCNAPSTFQRMMDEVLAGMKWESGRDYIDDIIIGSSTFEKHLEDLQEVFDCLRKHNLKVKLTKCNFCKNQLLYLGHIIKQEGIKPNPQKIEAIEKISPPVNIPELRRYLGLTSYYRKFIPSYSRIAKPLNMLLRKGEAYKWTSECQKAFEILKKKLMEAPILRFPDFKKEFLLYTDASKECLGAILSQQDEEGREYVIAYASRTTSKPEKKYSTTELECLAMVWSMSYFRVYLHGHKFRVITDHVPLKGMKDSPTSNNRISRWMLKLSEYDFTIVSRPGKEHKNVDALSRTLVAVVKGKEQASEQEIPAFSTPMESEQVEQQETLEEIPKSMPIGTSYNAREQDQDPEVFKIKEQLKRMDLTPEEQKKIRGYRLIGEELYFKVWNRRKEAIHSWVVPKHLREKTMWDHHDNILAGHRSKHKTLELILRNFYWHGIKKDVSVYVNTCVDCTIRKGVPSSTGIQLMSIPSSYPWEKMGADVLGPLPLTEQGNRYIIVFTDHFTKWVEAFAIPNQTAETVARIMETQIICRYGHPKILITDRGTNFMSAVIEKLNFELGVKHSTTAAYHPQTNGITERFNRTLCEMLTMYISDNQRDWDKYLPHVLYAYRNTVHESTKETPFFLMHGRDTNLSKGILEKEGTEPETTEEYKAKMMDTLTEVWNRVKYYSDMISQKRERANQGKMKHTYKEGDLVWVYLPIPKKGKVMKLSNRWKGPYRIVIFVTPVTVKLKRIGDLRRTLTLHISRLKPYLGPHSFSEEEPKITQEESKIEEEEEGKSISKGIGNESEEEEPENMDVEKEDSQVDRDRRNYEVDRIINKRRKKGKTEYLIRWKGYQEEDDTWEPEENLHCDQKILEFEKKSLTCEECGFLAKSSKGKQKHLNRHYP